MNPKTLVKLSNIVGIVSIILLVYWVFIFISMTVFDLKIFRKNITETFALSILGILALMAGALIINIMFNLTRIAEKHNHDNNPQYKDPPKKLGLVIFLSFPIIFILLLGGDFLTSSKKEKVLTETAKSILENSSHKTEKLLSYSFNKNWILETSEILQLMSSTDKDFPHISVITKDKIEELDVFLAFKTYPGNTQDSLFPLKKNYIIKTSKEERDYLNEVFLNNSDKLRYNSNRGKYELFYPFIKNNKVIVLRFSKYQRYGKIGS